MSDRPHPLLVKLAAKRARHLARPRIVRGLTALAGFAVLVAGVIMLALPGPAFVVIPVGLSLLALEFTWAERALEAAVVKAEKARVASARPAAKKLTACAATALIAVAVALYCTFA